MAEPQWPSEAATTMYKDICKSCEYNQVHLILQGMDEEWIYVGVCRGGAPVVANVRASFIIQFDERLIWNWTEDVSKEQLLERISPQTDK